MIYFDNNKNAYAFKIDNPIFSCTESLWQDAQENEGKYIWQDNMLILNPNYEEEQKKKERKRLNMLSLTKREVFLALYKAKRITPDQLKMQIDNPEALIEFEYANEYFRGNPLIDMIGEKLGYTTDELDYLFENKELPIKADIVPDLDSNFGVPDKESPVENMTVDNKNYTEDN